MMVPFTLSSTILTPPPWRSLNALHGVFTRKILSNLATVEYCCPAQFLETVLQAYQDTKYLPLQPPATMPKKAPKSHTPEDQVFLTVAKELRMETTAGTILNHLKELHTALKDERTADNRLRLFLREGGLPTVIGLLRGRATTDSTPDADSLPSAISEQAGDVLTALLGSKSGPTELAVAKGVVPLLLDAVRDAPTSPARLSAAHGLLVVADARPTMRRAMAEGGVIGVLLRLLIDCGECDAITLEMVGPSWELAQDMLRWERIAMQDLREAICGPEVDMAFSALAVLQVRVCAVTVSAAL
jgi:hypothetical protein